jgi:C2 domain
MGESEARDPVLRHSSKQKQDRLTSKFVNQTGKIEKKVQAYRPVPKTSDSQNSKGPAGGFDPTPVPRAPLGYTLKFTLHCAENLPIADIRTISSDPYVIATLKTNLPKRHKADPDLKFRTKTIHRDVNPKWEAEWVVANVPASGFFLKCRLYDEDSVDHDDRLGNVHVYVDSISDSWKGFKERKYDIKKRMGSKRAYFVRGCAVLFNRNLKMSGEMTISIENLGKTEGEQGGRMWTVGPLAWSQHYSPLIGMLVGTKDVGEGKDGKKTMKYKYVGDFSIVIPYRLVD